MDGVLRCTLYAFGPNRAHYCGPEANQEIFSYLNEGLADPGLTALLKEFKTLYPYLKLIAEANHIQDPFDDKVVEAYWLGNELLEKVGRQKLWRHLKDGQGLHQKLTGIEFKRLVDKVAQGALPHHSFHVLDVWRVTGHNGKEQNIDILDSCRISWGEVVKIAGPSIEVKTEPLLVVNNKLTLGQSVRRQITRPLTSHYDIEQLAAGQIISLHWGIACEVIDPIQLANLKKYTLHHLRLANLTI